MTSPYDLLRQRCGLSQEEAAHFHDVSLNSLQSWCAGRRTAPPGVLAELRALYRGIADAGKRLIIQIDALGASGNPEDDPKNFTLGIVESIAAAKRLGFPCPGAHGAALGLAIAALADDVAVTLAPYRDGVLTARAAARSSRAISASTSD